MHMVIVTRSGRAPLIGLIVLLASSCDGPLVEHRDTQKAQHALSAPFRVATLGNRVVDGDSFPGGPQAIEPVWASVGPVLYFAADDGIHGTELWRTDGTATGTRLVRDVRPGSTAGLMQISEGTLQTLNGTLFAILDDGTYGAEVWTSDGTARGTTALPNRASRSQALRLLRAGSSVYFPSFGPGIGREALWATEGRDGGARFLANVVVRDAIEFQGRYFFSGGPPAAPQGLWVSDGTDGGTRLFADVCSGSCMNGTHHLAAVGNQLYFTIRLPTNRSALYRTDGQAQPTQVYQFDAGVSASDWMVGLGSLLFFDVSYASDTRELWVTDGGSVHRLGGASPGPNTGSIATDELVVSAGKVFFRGKDSARGVELWVSDGTDVGTRLVRDIATGPRDGVAMRPTAFDGGVLFWADDGVSGIEPWFSDGTAQGTRLVANLAPGAAGTAAPTPFFVHEGWAYFSGSDGTSGQELWRTDGTATGTAMVANVARNEGADPSSLCEIAGTLFFAGIPANVGDAGKALMKSDGTPQNTVLVSTLQPGRFDEPRPRDLVALNGSAYFAASHLLTTSLWRSDGTPARTTPVGRLLSSWANPEPTRLTVSSGLVFGAASSVSAYQLASYDPAAGFDAGSGSLVRYLGGPSLVQEVVATDGGVWVVGWGRFDTLLWHSDGTPSGTREVAVVKRLLEPRRNRLLADVGGVAYYSDSSRLYRSDGTDAGTTVVRSVSGAIGFFPMNLTTVGNRLFFSGSEAGGRELWTTNAAGTVDRVADLNPFGDSNPENLTPWGARLLFTADDGTGRALMVTDGKLTGTSRVTALPLGLAGDDDRILAIANGPAFFPAGDDRGNEPWVLHPDGGLSLLGDVNPGVRSSNPSEFTRAGDLVFFGAEDGTGKRLWAVSLSGSAAGGGSAGGAAGGGAAGGGSAGGGSAGGGSAGGGSAGGGSAGGGSAGGGSAGGGSAGGGSVAGGSAVGGSAAGGSAGGSGVPPGCGCASMNLAQSFLALLLATGWSRRRSRDDRPRR